LPFFQTTMIILIYIYFLNCFPSMFSKICFSNFFSSYFLNLNLKQLLKPNLRFWDISFKVKLERELGCFMNAIIQTPTYNVILNAQFLAVFITLFQYKMNIIIYTIITKGKCTSSLYNNCFSPTGLQSLFKNKRHFENVKISWLLKITI